MSIKVTPIKHAEPTPATLKELYANAYRCAFPNCKRPLYKVNEETGVRSLNSTASHICARSEGGPRWDAKQSEIENRSIDNLLALCLEHAKEVDDQKTCDQYPAEKLRKWRKQQLADFDSLGKQGWSLTETDVEKLSQYFESIENVISSSVVYLGGKGGSSPGAGGGGGGVFGSQNSTAGNGGKGGDTIFLNGQDATTPGAGGGGAGALGDGAVAAGGGDGGESVETILSTDTFDTLVYEVGKGGKSSEDGGDTLIKLIKNGKIAKIITAKGGKAGKPGQHGDLSSIVRPISEEDLRGGSGISTILFTDLYREKNGLYTLLDAAWDNYKVSSLPFSSVWPLFMVFSFGNLQTPTVISCSIKIKDPTSKTVVEQAVKFSKLNTEILYARAGYVFQFEITQLGLWSAEIISGDYTLATLQINVASI